MHIAVSSLMSPGGGKQQRWSDGDLIYTVTQQNKLISTMLEKNPTSLFCHPGGLNNPTESFDCVLICVSNTKILIQTKTKIPLCESVSS